MDSCCPAPCSCPCTNWPPSPGPCCGLMDEYTVSLTVEWKYFTGVQCCPDCSSETPFVSCTLNLTKDLTADAESPCRWTIAAFNETCGVLSLQFVLTLFLDTVNCQWAVLVSQSTYECQAIKATGSTPVGSYEDCVECENIPLPSPYSIYMKVSNVSVSQAAP